MKNTLLNYVCAIMMLGSLSLFAGCDDDEVSDCQEPNSSDIVYDKEMLTSLICRVDDFSDKSASLRKNTLVRVVLSDVSDSNLKTVAEVLIKMSQPSISKAGSDGAYRLDLVMESPDSSLTLIPTGTFMEMPSLVSISIPESVKTISDGAFANCGNLEFVTIMGTGTSYSKDAFQDCNSRLSVSLGAAPISTVKTKDLANYLKSSKSNPVTVYMDIEGYDHTDVMIAISNTNKQVKLVIPDGVETFDYVFDDRSPKDEKDQYYKNIDNNLISVTIPSSVQSIGTNAFRSCPKLGNVDIKTSLLQEFFAASDAELLTVNVDLDGYDHTDVMIALSKAVYKVKLVIPNGVGVLQYVFDERSPKDPMARYYKDVDKSLVSVTIPSSVKYIGPNAFRECISLASVSIPDGVDSIGYSAFSLNRSLTDFVLPSSLLKIGNNVFFYCESISEIVVPASVVSVGSSAFEGCKGLRDVVISDGVSIVSSYAFSGCKNISTITIPESVTSLGACVFDDCDMLSAIYVGNDLYKKYCNDYPKMYVPDGTMQGQTEQVKPGESIK